MKSANERPTIHPDGSERASVGATFYASKTTTNGLPVSLRLHTEDGKFAKYLMEGRVPDYMAKSALLATVAGSVVGFIMGSFAGWFTFLTKTG